jgi:Tol biopolymer transport system component
MRESHTIRHISTREWSAAVAIVAALASLVCFTAVASAFQVVSEPGQGSGQVQKPNGVAVNYETGRLYVADRDNSRVDVFGPTGSFDMAFGWGVRDGKENLQTCTTATTCRMGLPGAGNGQFSGLLEGIELGGPTAIAVDNSCLAHSPPLTELTIPTCEEYDPSAGDVYVVDQASYRVEKFDEEGNFILTFGGGVDKTAPGNVCTAESKHTCGRGSGGFGEGEFSSAGRSLVGIGPAGTVYVVDSTHGHPEETERKYRLQRFEPSGAEIAPQRILAPEGELATALAVDSTGDFYVGSDGGPENAIRKYEPDGSLIGVVLEERAEALAVDLSGDLFLAGLTEGGKDIGEGRSILELDPGGNPLRRFGYGVFEEGVSGLAPYHSATGDIYASERGDQTRGQRVLHLDFPAISPLVLPKPCTPSPLGNAKATLQAKVNPEGKATTYHFQYITDADFIANGNSFSGASPAISTTESASIGSDFVMHKASAEAVVVPETKYRCRVVATNADAPAGVDGPEGAFTSLPPLQIGAEWTSGVSTEAAALNAEVNPLGIPTTGYFEYVDEASYQESGFANARTAPEGEPIDFGAGESLKTGAAAIAGLQAGTTYRYRFVATDSLIEPKEIPGPTEAFRTYRSGVGALSDHRAYELVSPAEKNSADVAVGPPAGGLVSYSSYRLIDAGASSGEAVTYTSWTAFAEAKGSPSVNQYLSKRTEGGWRTESISPPPPAPLQFIPPYRGFSADLGFGALVSGQSTPGGEVFDNLYLRDNQTGIARALTTETPKVAGVAEVCFNFAGASADGSRAFFAANASYAGAPEGKGFNLYEWTAAEGLRPLSILPGKSAAVAPTEATSFGAVSSAGNCQSGEKVSRHVASADGQRVFWTYAPNSGPTQLLVRIGGEETVQLDKKIGGTGSSGGGVFQAASADGSKAFFTDKSKLKAGAGEGDLYLYELPGQELKDLTPEALTPGPEAAGILGVVGSSDDGAYLYFAATGVLSGEEENGAGERAEAGADNLYLYHEAQVGFVATLSADDSSDWSSVPRELSARVSPDGRHLAFLSVEAEKLAGYDNTIAAGTHCHLPQIKGQPLTESSFCPQAFLYDADAGTLVCASCNPSGERPQGPSTLPGWSNPYEGPRYLSDDGSRLFFESRDALLPADENGKGDVYEFERAGTGTCTSESPSFALASGGCLDLISSGKSSAESFLIDASSAGRDAFFSTRSPLVGWDGNENYDVYDAREGGGFAEPEAASNCEAEACKTPPAALSSSSSAATTTFRGPGNVLAGRPRCAKGKVRRRSRCVKPGRHGKAGHRRGKAPRNGRASR